MARVIRSRAVLVWSSLLVAACGGASPPASNGSPSAADDGAAEPAAGSPAAECLATAGAAREPKADEPMTVTVVHIVVKHGSSGPHQRTRGEACLRLLEARDKLAAGADFDDVVAEYSDEPGAASRGGTLGAIQRDDVDPDFADAAFRLEVDQASHVVESKAGFHLIMRTE